MVLNNKFRDRQTILLFTILFIISFSSCNPKEKVDDLNLLTMIQPIDGDIGVENSNSGFVSDNVLDDPDYFNWGGSVIKGDSSKYHMFYARWPEGQTGREHTGLDSIFGGMKGWLKYSEIAYATSDQPTGPFRYVKTVFSGSENESDWNCYSAHNPHIKKFDGKYYLYYISNNFNDSFYNKNWDEKRNHWYKYCTSQRIGVMTANSIEDLANGKAVHSELPLIHPDNKNTFHLTTNPSVTQGPDGNYYMMFKSWGEPTHPMTFWMAVSDSPTGQFELAGNVFKDADFSCEDPYLWYDKNRKRFYAIVKDFSGSRKLSDEFGALVLITSKNGIDHWQPAKHTLVSPRKIINKQGIEAKLAHLERPQLLFGDNGEPIALYAAASLKNPFAVNSPVISGLPFHNTVNLHLALKKNAYLLKPRIQIEKLVLNQPTVVSISSENEKVNICYTTDGTEPSESSIVYEKPLVIKENTTIKARALKFGLNPSFVASKKIDVFNRDYEIELKTNPSKKYSDRNTITLCDGIRGSFDYNSKWLGFKGDDLIVDYHFKNVKDIHYITIGFLHIPKSWIFAPEKLIIETSDDGINYILASEKKISVKKDLSKPKILKEIINIDKKEVQTIRIQAKNIGVTPVWHSSPGGTAWLFVDEITIK